MVAWIASLIFSKPYLVLADDLKITLRDLLSPLWRFPQLQEVFLSCCETGLSYATYMDKQERMRPELLDEQLSLGTGFLVAGARSVISTHWAVDDLATAFFTREYHRSRRTESQRLTSLHQAREILRRTSQQQWLQGLESDFKDAYKTMSELCQAKHPTATTALTVYNQIGELKEWLKENFAPEDIPFADYRYWGAFYCLGLP